ncbi:MAG TPA: hypothetical protein VEG84_09105 [Thermoanaerobaculia bacterium]|nr:hypothetical protein [Thermoanaerobaculia bacterium]
MCVGVGGPPLPGSLVGRGRRVGRAVGEGGVGVGRSGVAVGVSVGVGVGVGVSVGVGVAEAVNVGDATFAVFAAATAVRVWPAGGTVGAILWP